jgi:hypothetical protein
MTFIRKFVGILLILAALGGLVFSIAGIVALQQIKPVMVLGLQNSVNLLIQTLDTTSQGLAVTQTALKSSVDTIANLQTTLETTVKGIDSANPMIDQISKAMDEDVPNTILATQNSLRTAQESAVVIDSLLSTLSKIPLIGLSYSPKVPLAQALGDVADSLEGLPVSLKDMSDSLVNTQSDIQTFQADLSITAESVGGIKESVAQYGSVVKGYEDSLDVVKTQLKALSDGLPNIVRILVLALTVFLVWMAIANLGLLSQGWEMLSRKNIAVVIEAEKKAEEKEKKEE